MLAGLYGWEHDPTKHEAVAECIPAQLQRLFVALQVRAGTVTGHSSTRNAKRPACMLLNPTRFRVNRSLSPHFKISSELI